MHVRMRTHMRTCTLMFVRTHTNAKNKHAHRATEMAIPLITQDQEEREPRKESLF